MSKGKKRTRAQTEKEEEAKTNASSSSQPQNNNNKKSARAVTRAKRGASKPETEPEYFEDKRNLEDFWKEVFPVGTEWEKLESVYQFNWNFSNIENAFEEGEFCMERKSTCLVAQSLVPFKDEQKAIHIPVVVAVEEVVPMKKMKMNWVPYIPLENSDSQIKRLKSQIFKLSCTQRKSALRHLKIERLKKFEYCLPYFYYPLKQDNLEQRTEVQILFPSEPKPVFCEYDWEMDDDLEEFTNNLISEEALSEDQKDAFMEFVKEKTREAKKANKDAREARKKAIEEMSEDTRTVFESMRFYKFYLVKMPDTPDVSKFSKHII